MTAEASPGKMQREVAVEKEGKFYRARYDGFDLKLLPFHANRLVREWDIWEMYYAPIDLKGKTVLDIGAGCLETAVFYLGKGAAKIVCVENNPDAVTIAKENIQANPQMKVELLNEPVSLEQLKLPHDFLKMNVEGAESILLDYCGKLGPCVIEAYKIGLWDIPKALMEKFPELKPVYSETNQIMPATILQGIS